MHRGLTMKQHFMGAAFLLSVLVSTALSAAEPSKQQQKVMKPKPGDIIEGKDGTYCSEIIDLDNCTITCEPEGCIMQQGQTCSGQLPKERCGQAKTLERSN